jgi:micrococcal nuclease
MGSPRSLRSRHDALFVTVMAAFAALPAVACTLAGGDGSTATPPLGSAPLSPGGRVTAVVTSDVDGDTIHVRVDGREEKVRFIGVNSPEVSWYGREGECYGPAAAVYTRHRLVGRRIGLVFDVRLRDVYGRLLAYVYVGSELFNLTLVRLGYATNDPVSPDTRMADLFATSEAAARARGAGRWSACPGA